MDWEDLRHFLALAEEGSLSAAARRLGVDHTTVARRVAALEATLGVRLLDRLPRSVAVTEAGRRVATLGRSMGVAAEAVIRAADAEDGALVGPVTVSAPPILASTVVAGRLAALRARHPGILVTLLGDMGRADLDRRRADVALRLTRPDRGDLVARRVASMPFGFFGALETAETEADWDLIAHEESTAHFPQARWLESRLAGRSVVFRSNDLATHVAAAVAGLGVALMPLYLGTVTPGLRRLASREDPPVREVWMVVHDDLRRVPRIRLVMDFLAEALGETLGRVPPKG
jgi:DNA-binding transcriptional LysR family regulator